MQEFNENINSLISLMYDVILGRTADESGADAIKATVKDRDSFLNVLNQFFHSEEAIRRGLTSIKVAQLYAAFVSENPEDTTLKPLLFHFLKYGFGRQQVSWVSDLSKSPQPKAYAGSLWVVPEYGAIEGWLVVSEDLDSLVVKMHTKEHGVVEETCKVEAGIAFVDFLLPMALGETYDILYDESTSVISLYKSGVLRNRLFNSDYYVSVHPEAKEAPFSHFIECREETVAKFNPFSVPQLEELRALDSASVLRVDSLEAAPFLEGLLDVEYCAGNAGRPIDDIVQYATQKVMDGEWIDFHPLLVRADFERHAATSLLAWIEQLSDPTQSLVGLRFDRFSPHFYRKTCDKLSYENEFVDYIYNKQATSGDPHPFCNTWYATQYLPGTFIPPRRGIWADSFCNPGKYPIPFSPFWEPLSFQHLAVTQGKVREQKNSRALDLYLHQSHGLPPSQTVVPSALVHSFLGYPLEECAPEKLTGFDVVEALEAALLAKTNYVDTPQLSICILNFNKAGFSAISAITAAVNANLPVEVIVFDNGSVPMDFATITHYTENLGNVKVVRSAKNLYFGEGNNVMIDMSRSEFVLFLNNDAFVSPTLIDELVEHLDKTPEASAVGPTFLFPNLEIQEAGGTISNCGRQVQLHKHTSLEKHRVHMTQEVIPGVQYVSAACCCVRRSVLDDIGGFDYIYEPFYFEDTDLCKRMEALDYRLDYLPSSFVIHYENASTREFLSDGFMTQIEKNRMKFQERWLYTEKGFKPREILPVLQTPFDKERKTAVVYTPFDVSLGGGERYIMSCALALCDTYNVLFCSDNYVSRARMSFMIQDLRIGGPRAGAIKPCLMEDVEDWSDVEVMIVMGNEIIPPVAMRGKVNVFHCQYPFPAHHSDRFEVNRLKDVSAYFVNSTYTQEKVCREQRKLGYDIPVIRTGAPVAKALGDAVVPKNDGIIRILNTGRFEPLGHSKRQDVAVKLFRKFYARNPNSKLSLVGSVSGIERRAAFVNELRQLSGDLPVDFHIDASKEILEEELAAADVYFHACGFGVDSRSTPERLEHFGIAVLEAMASGAIPVVYNKGGPAEIVREAGVGYTYGSIQEAVVALEKIANLSSDEKAEMVTKVRKAASKYFDTAFQKAIVDHVANLVADQ
ncbi:MAG: glycosyltransferase [Sulfitobacter sp.]